MNSKDERVFFMTLEKKKLDYKWVILVVGFMMVFVCLGFCSSNKGLYLKKITEALDIERSAFSINDSCRFIAQAVINLFFGALLYKFGIRKMTAFGFLALISSMLIYAFAESVYIFYIGGTLLGIGLTFTTTTMASTMVRRWFTKDIGKYTGIVFAANGLGGALAAQIVSPMINEEGNVFGYRNAYLFVAGLLLVVGTIVVVLIRERPVDAPIQPMEKSKKKARGALWSGVPYDEVKTKPFFFMAAFVVLCTGLGLQGINGAWTAHMEDVGLSDEFVKNVSSFYSILLTVSKLAVGAMYDRYGLRTIMIVCQTSAVLAFALLASVSAGPTGMILAFGFAVLYALALPLETLVIPLIANDLFGSASYEKLLGIMLSMNYTGYALGGPLVNLCYDKLDTYCPILWVLAALTVGLLVMFQLVINSAYKRKKQILAAAEANQ